MRAIYTTLRHPKFSGSASEFSVSYDYSGEHRNEFVMVATVTIRTGDCAVHMYGLPCDLRSLAASLLKAADAVDAAQAQGAA